MRDSIHLVYVGLVSVKYLDALACVLISAHVMYFVNLNYGKFSL